MERPHLDDLGNTTCFTLVEELDHDNLVPAVNRYLARASPVKYAYFAAKLLALVLAVYLVVRSGQPFVDGFSQFGMGFLVGFLILLPIHEHLHALAYRRFGATNVSVVYRWRSLNAYCAADRFVADARQFAWVCLLPFLVLTTALLLAVALFAPPRPFLAGALLLHTGACSGDFALLNLVWAHRATGLFTYDDMAAKRTYFFVPARRPSVASKE